MAHCSLYSLVLSLSEVLIVLFGELSLMLLRMCMFASIHFLEELGQLKSSGW